MLFHSQEFIVLFLPAAVGIYYALARHQAARQWWLIAASLVFYGWWDLRFVPLLIGQTLMTWLIVELAIRKDWRWLLYFAIVANLAVLGLFKYLDFGASILEQVTGREFAKASLVLPIGISFYTFELISYLVVVGDLRARRGRRRALEFHLFPILTARRPALFSWAKPPHQPPNAGRPAAEPDRDIGEPAVYAWASPNICEVERKGSCLRAMAV